MDATVLLAFVTTLAVQEAPMSRAAAGTPVKIGENVSGVLSPGDPPLPGHGPARWYEFVAESTGPVTVSLDSYDFNAFLRIESEAGETVAENDDGWLATNSRVVLSVTASARYRIAAAAAKEEEGGFALTVTGGEVPVPSGKALLETAIDFHSRAAERSLARGDKKAASVHRLLEGEREYDRSQYPEAKNAFESSLGLARELGDRGGEAGALGNLGTVSYALGDYLSAREYFEKHLTLALELGDRSGEAKARGNLGIVCASLGDYRNAREYFEKHLSLFREMGDRVGEARALGNLGGVFYSLAEYPQARQHFEKALASSRELGDRKGEAAALGNLGSVYTTLGDYPKAQECLEGDLAIARELGDRMGETAALGNLGNISISLGDYTKAQERIERALALARELGHRRWEAAHLGSLGAVYCALGNYPKAREHLEGGLAIARQLGDRAAEAEALVILGLVHRTLGDYRNAREHCERALAIFTELGNPAGEAKAVGNLGTVYYALGDYAAARENFERAVALTNELGMLDAQGSALARLGVVYLDLGKVAEARQSAVAASVLFTETGAEDRGLGALSTLARAALAERDSSQVLGALEKVAHWLEAPKVRALGIAEASGLRSRWSPWGEIAQDLTALRIEEAGSDADRRARVAEEGFREAGRWKGRALLEGIAEYRRGGRSPEATEVRREWRETLANRDRVLQRISETIQEKKPAEEVAALREEARSLRTKAEDFARRLREVSHADAAVDLPIGADPDSVRKVLGKGTALLEYTQGEKRLYAYVLAEGRLAFLDLGERKAIEEEAERFISGVSLPDSLATLDRIEESGRALFDKLLAPLLREVGRDPARLVLVPIGPLAALPFEALVVGRKGKEAPRTFADLEFVVDRWEVCYAPASTVLVPLASAARRDGEPKALVLADPLYPSEPGERAPPSAPEPLLFATRGTARSVPEAERFARVSRTRDEALALSRLLLEPAEEDVASGIERVAPRRSASLAGRRFELHLGDKASLSRLATDLRPYSILHLAAHGFVDRAFPQRTGIALSFREGEDGYLAIADVMELGLDADLVVLSACETGRGEWRGGEGVESMARAFLYAGARAVVASLWQVEDKAAAETMASFYAGALKGKRPWSQALREAKLAVRGSKVARGVPRGFGTTGKASDAPAGIESGHPFFWAPFVFVGLPR